MRIFKDTDYDFLGWWKFAAVLSALAIGVGIASIVVQGGVNLGIDFAGGSQIVVRFAEPPDLGQLRDVLADAGLASSELQEFDAADEILIRTPRVEAGQEAEVVADINAALDELYPPPADAPEAALDLNTVGAVALGSRILEANPLGFDLMREPGAAEDRYRAAAEAILDVRAREGLLTSWDQVEASGVDEAILEVVRANGYLGSHHVVSTEWVGPQVGRDLRRQALQAMGWALAGMLVYISYRFEFRYGVGAVAALVHDVMITLGAFSLTGREFNLPVIAAFLTIVGYSLNDTVVIFDRIRENNQTMRRMSFYDRINLSINQTLSRTVLTSTTTLLVVICLFVYGGQVINDFSFALLVGVVSGTYSTVYIASPVVYFWQQYRTRRS